MDSKLFTDEDLIPTSVNMILVARGARRACIPDGYERPHEKLRKKLGLQRIPKKGIPEFIFRDEDTEYFENLSEDDVGTVLEYYEPCRNAHKLERGSRYNISMYYNGVEIWNFLCPNKVNKKSVEEFMSSIKKKYEDAFKDLSGTFTYTIEK